MRTKRKEPLKVIHTWTGQSAYVVYGDAVYKLQPATDERGGFRTPILYKVLEERDRRKKSPLEVLVMFGLILLLAAVLTAYAGLWFGNTQHVRNIARLESSYIDLKRGNDEEWSRLHTEVNLDEIQRVAIYEYGMQFPDSNQIVTVQNLAPCDYVKVLEKGKQKLPK